MSARGSFSIQESDKAWHVRLIALGEDVAMRVAKVEFGVAKLSFVHIESSQWCQNLMNQGKNKDRPVKAPLEQQMLQCPVVNPTGHFEVRLAFPVIVLTLQPDNSFFIAWGQSYDVFHLVGGIQHQKVAELRNQMQLSIHLLDRAQSVALIAGEDDVEDDNLFELGA